MEHQSPISNKGWSQWIIAGLSAVLSMSLAVNGALLLRDRDTLDKLLSEINKKLDQLIETNHRQDKVIEKLCLLMNLPYEERRRALQQYLQHEK